MEYNFFETVLYATIIVLVLGYYYLTSTHDFWSRRGVLGPKPSLLFGNFKRIVFAKISVSELLTEGYKTYQSEPMFGLFAFRTPILVLKDPELIKDVLIKDFTVFSDRGIRVPYNVEPLAQHLFNLEPERWRPLRSKLSPVFTSGKLRNMFSLLMECADHFEDFLKLQVEKNSVVECHELAAKFTTDVIGVCAFGLEMNSLREEDSEFLKYGRQAFHFSGLRYVKRKIRDFMPLLYRLLKPIMYDREINDFFVNMMTQTVGYRQKNNFRRNDFIDLLIDIKNDPSKIDDIEMTDELMTAQVFVFFLAGFETSSTTISHALYELAQNHSVQSKLRQEIKEEHERNSGRLQYESIKNMKYLNQVFSETLRKYPPGTVLQRQSTLPYTFSGTKVSIPKGTKILIPVHAIQKDPKIYPDPDVFDPERFNDDNVKKRHSSSYLPFGDGPRNCIGARFAHYQTKVGIITFLRNYQVDVCDETCIPYVNNPKSVVLTPIGGTKLKLTKV